MTLEEQLVQALCAHENDTVIEVLTAGAKANYRTVHPGKSYHVEASVSKIALDYKNYQGVLHLLDFGALPNLDADMRNYLRENMKSLLADPPSTNTVDD